MLNEEMSNGNWINIFRAQIGSLQATVSHIVQYTSGEF